MNKKILSALLGVLAIVAVAGFVSYPALAGNDRPIAFDKLPSAARAFVTKHFADQKVSFAKYDNEILDKNYEVIFTNGTKIEFDRKGNWLDVDCKQGSVPAAIVPKAIADYIKANHPGLEIRQIEKRGRRGYQVDLSNDVDLRFDTRGAFVGFDD